MVLLVLSFLVVLLIGAVLIWGLLMVVKNVGNMKDPDKWWNPLRVAPLEGEIEFYMISSATGPLGTIVTSITGWYLSAAGKITEGSKPDNEVTELDELNEFLREKFGLVWVGFFRKRQKFKRRYNKYGKESAASTKYTIVPREEEAHSLYYQTVVGIEAIGAETSENFPVNAIVGGTVRIVNPNLAQYLAGDLYSQVTIAVQGVIRSFIGRQTFESLRDMRKEKGVSPDANGTKAELLSKLIQEIDGLNPKLEKEFGVQIINTSFIEFDMQDGNRDALAATQARNIAELQAEAVKAAARGVAEAEKIKAQGLADAQNILTDAEKRRVSEVYATISSIPRGSDIRRSEAIEKTNLRAFAEGGPPGKGFQILVDES